MLKLCSTFFQMHSFFAISPPVVLEISTDCRLRLKRSSAVFARLYFFFISVVDRVALPLFCAWLCCRVPCLLATAASATFCQQQPKAKAAGFDWRSGHGCRCLCVPARFHPWNLGCAYATASSCCAKQKKNNKYIFFFFKKAQVASG